MHIWTHFLDRYDADDDSEESHVIKYSPFYSEQQFIDVLANSPGLSILDLNIRNIYSNFDELLSFINRVNILNPISIICLNECWIKQNSDVSQINLPNYKMFCLKGNRVGHGHCGLITYVHEQFKATELFLTDISTDWDYMCVEISHCKPNSKKYIISNIYRLPGMIVDYFTQFVNEFTSFLTSIKNLKHSAFICGDFNIDLLKVGINRHCSSYFDNVTSKGFFPRITLPTRLSNTVNINSNTLIDNILTNNIEENSKAKSGILINDISDHKMIFTFQENNRYTTNSAKYVEIEIINDNSIRKFVDELVTLNICEKLNNTNDSNVQANYEVFARCLKHAKDKHLPKKKVKYNKKKHKQCKWMTNSILKCINIKDKLYKTLIQTDRENQDLYLRLRNEFQTYRAMLRRSIREAKRLYYIRIFNTYKNDIKKTWSVINESLKSSANSHMNNEFVVDNRTICNSDDIANLFNDYFINIGHRLSTQINPIRPYTDYLGEQIDARFKFKLIDENHILKIINKLKNKPSYGHDNISNK